jgi:hypothetical protein
MLRKLRKRRRGGWYVGNSGEGRRGDNPLHPLEIPEQRAYRSQVDDADVR